MMKFRLNATARAVNGNGNNNSSNTTNGSNTTTTVNSTDTADKNTINLKSNYPSSSSQKKKYHMSLSRLSSLTKPVLVVIFTRRILATVTIGFLLTLTGIGYNYYHDKTSSTLEISPGSCEQPSLPRGSIHIVVAGWKRHETPSGVSFSPNRKHNYLWDIGLTNADIFWYRRIDPHMPLDETLHGPCGIQMHERLLLPNHGREATAFLDHVLEFYDDPPPTLIFMHGHVSYAWHTKCDAVMARTAYYYRNLVRSPLSSDDGTGNATDARVRNHMMSLTAEAGTKDFIMNWFGWNRLDTGRTGPIIEKWSFFERWKDVIKEKSPYQPSENGDEGNPYRSCCANFIVPGERIRRFPREFWEDLRATMIDRSHEDYYMGQDLFEFVIYEFLGDEKEFTRDQVQNFYDEADSLAIGNQRNPQLLKQQDPDPAILWRIQNCEELREKEYVRIRKVRNTLGFFGIDYN